MEFLTSKKDFEKTTEQNPSYQKIAAFFRKEKFTIVQLAFTIHVSVPFVNFLTVFESEGPLVHIIDKAMKDLLKIVMKIFLKENQLGDKLKTGAKIERLLKNLSPFEHKKEREAMLQFYEESVAYLQRKT